MSEEKPLASSELPPPQLPARAEELFRIVFSPGATVEQAPAAALQAEAHAYQMYVMQFAQRLEIESRRLVAIASDEAQLGQQAKNLMQIELRRKVALAPYLAKSEPASTTTPKAAVVIWKQLQIRLRDAMTRELEAVRDARLRLEIKRAELINQRATVSVRIVLRGSAQVRLHFGRQAGHAAEKN